MACSVTIKISFIQFIFLEIFRDWFCFILVDHNQISRVDTMSSILSAFSHSLFLYCEMVPGTFSRIFCEHYSVTLLREPRKATLESTVTAVCASLSLESLFYISSTSKLPKKKKR
jgi:hypothetical protein